MTESPSAKQRLENIAILDADTLVDPYDTYALLRDEAPVFHVPMLNVHYVTRYDLVREAIKDTKTYSSKFDRFMVMANEAGRTTLPDDVREQVTAISAKLIANPPTMLTLDEPDHTRYRSLVSRLFTGSQVKRSEDQVRAVVEETATRFANGDARDFMSGFAFPVPLRIIADRLGIPREDRDVFDAGAMAAADGLRMSPMSPEATLRRAEVALALQDLLVRLIDECRDNPRNDMISLLATSKLDGENRLLTHGEALSILGQFLVAGHETTTSTFGWGMLLLCRQPELQDTIRGNAGLIKTFVEEALRIESPVQGLPRVVTRDTTLGGYPLKAGELIMLRYGAANRDERQFDNPDLVDVHRKKAGMQLAFGAGVHHCIGAPLARQELNLGFAALLDRMANIRLADGHAEPKAEPSLILRNLPTLPLRFDRR